MRRLVQTDGKEKIKLPRWKDPRNWQYYVAEYNYELLTVCRDMMDQDMLLDNNVCLWLDRINITDILLKLLYKVHQV